MHGSRKRRKANLERVRRHRRLNDPAYWNYQGGSTVTPEKVALLEQGRSVAQIDRPAVHPNQSRLHDIRERTIELTGMGVMALRKVGADHKIKGCWSMKKPVLINAILDAEGLAS